MEVAAEDPEMDAASYIVENADPAVVEQPALIVLLPEVREDVKERAADVSFDAPHESARHAAAEEPAAEAAADITTATLTTELPPEDAEAYGEAVTSSDPPATRPLLRGEAGGATWRSSPRSTSTSFRKPFRPRADAAPPAWKQSTPLRRAHLARC
ncbi:uncharacterized protein LOC117642982 [Thrips palmi]|uniref:Uncharacterized protein LOC117642982 n=1 Tax=Thrips palmi TaxID=161013 RepID=A0A6P8YKE7_THRPL|nr:uncharacterized protein LOC117642982 [Thrips palmi]